MGATVVESYPVVNKNFSCFQGATWKAVVTYTDSAGAAVNLTGGTATMKARKITAPRLGVGAVVGSAVFTLSSPSSGIVLTTPASGIMTITLSAATTAAITPDIYDYDLEILLSGGDTAKIMYGTFEIKREASS